MAELCVVHLLWGPLGREPVERFAEAYCAHPAGRDHRLLLVFNGFTSDAERAEARAALGGIGDDELHLDAPVQDLDAYRQVVHEVDAERLVFLNSYSQVLADDWLDLLVRHAGPGVGLVGATGSWESLLTPAPLPLKAVRLPSFPPFPNPHVRTTGFTIERALARELRWPRIRRKSDAWKLENGKRSLSRQVQERGLRILVAGRDGVAYGPDAFHASATYRTGDQANLLISDNRTRDYATGDPALRRTLERLAWGAEAPAEVARR